jgi:hypothetical protein
MLSNPNILLHGEGVRLVEAASPVRQGSPGLHGGRRRAVDPGRYLRPMSAAGDVGDVELVAEDPPVWVRLVVAPAAGVFTPSVLPTERSGPPRLTAGLAVGRVDSLGRQVVVVSPFSGVLMGYLAAPGERVRPQQPLAWISPAAAPPAVRPRPAAPLRGRSVSLRKPWVRALRSGHGW